MSLNNAGIVSQKTNWPPLAKMARPSTVSLPWGGRIIAIGLICSYFLRASTLNTLFPLDLYCYVALALGSVYHLIARGSRINALVLFGILAIAMSVLSSLNPRESFVRWLGWLLVMASVGGVFAGNNARAFRKVAIESTIWWIHLMTWGSAVASFVGLQFSGRGVFWGIMGHSQVLGAIAALSALDALRRGLLLQRKKWYAAFFVAVMVSIMASSRAALLGLGLGVIPIAKMAGTRGHVFLSVFLAIGLFGYSFAMDNEQFLSMLDTTSTSSQRGLMDKGFTNTRDALWNERWKEFQSSQLFGIGFALGGREQRGIPDKEVVTEPGSGFLLLLSTTGLVGTSGFLLLLLQFFSGMKRAWNAIPIQGKVFIASWGVFWLVHLNFEGYLMAVGSPFCLILWTFFGYAIDQTRRQGSPKLQ